MFTEWCKINSIVVFVFFFQMTHISAIPLELIMYIFKWVVSVELDMKSLDQLARVIASQFWWRPRPYTLAIDHFWIALNLVMKARFSAKFLSWKLVFIHMQTKLIFIWKVLHLYPRFHNEVHSNSEMAYCK